MQVARSPRTSRGSSSKSGWPGSSCLSGPSALWRLAHPCRSRGLRGGSDFGYLTATAADMKSPPIAATASLRSTSSGPWRGLAIVFLLVLIVAIVLALTVPLVSVLHLKQIDEATAAAIVIMIAAQVLLLVSSLLLYGGFLCEGYYGEGVLIQSAIHGPRTVQRASSPSSGAGRCSRPPSS